MSLFILEDMINKICDDDKLYYIYYDSKNELLDQIEKEVQKKDVTTLTSFHNEQRYNLDQIMKEKLQ